MISIRTIRRELTVTLLGGKQVTEDVDISWIRSDGSISMWSVDLACELDDLLIEDDNGLELSADETEEAIELLMEAGENSEYDPDLIEEME